MDREAGERLRRNYDFLRKIERYLRRDANSRVSQIAGDTETSAVLSQWLGLDGAESFREELRRAMGEIRATFESVLHQERRRGVKIGRICAF